MEKNFGIGLNKRFILNSVLKGGALSNWRDKSLLWKETLCILVR